jgi:hypothetical protein
VSEGYAISCEPVVQSPVIVYDPDDPPAVMVEKVSFNAPSTIVRLVPLGMSRDDLGARFADYIYTDTITLTTEHGDACEGQLLGWNVDLADTSKAGIYYPFDLKLPPGVVLSERATAYTGVYVMDADEVYLRFIDEIDNTGVLNVTWLKEITEPELWLKIDGGEWEAADDWQGEDYSYFSFNHGTTLTLYMANFPSGHKYEFQVRYENGGVSVDNLLVDFTDGKPTYKPIEGDRSGGDREETELPPTDPDDDTPATPPSNPGDGTSTTPPTTPDEDTPTTLTAEPDEDTPTAPTIESDEDAPTAPTTEPGDGAPTTPPTVQGSTEGQPGKSEGSEVVNQQKADIAEVSNSPQTDSPAEPQAPDEPYSDGWARAAIASAIALAGVIAFFGIRRARLVKRP